MHREQLTFVTTALDLLEEKGNIVNLGCQGSIVKCEYVHEKDPAVLQGNNPLHTH